VVVNPVRRQLPVRSPLTARALAVAALDAIRPGSDPPARLRRLLGERYAADHVRLHSSGTHALATALRAAAAATAPERVVALPGYTCYDVATAAVGAELRIELYDLDPDTLAPDWDSVRRALRAGARIVVLAPLYGYPFDWAPVEALAREHGALLVEDAAQGAGALWDGKPIGSFGALSVLSFGRGKGWTGGARGALLVRGPDAPVTDEEPAPARGGRALALALALLLVGRPALYGLPHAVPFLHLGETRYLQPSPGLGMPAAAAALALATHGIAAAEVAQRRRTAAMLRAAVADVPGIREMTVPAGSAPGFLRLPIRIPGGAGGGSGARALGRLGVEPGYPATLASLAPVVRRMATSRAPDLPGADALAGELVTLPTHGAVRGRDVAGLRRALGGLTGRVSAS
jgi:perosamine synthetase